MRPISSQLQTFLATGQPFWSADLFTITLQTGYVFRLTSLDQTVSFGGNIYYAVGPMMERTRWGMVNTVQVSELVIRMLAGNDSTFEVNGVNIKLALYTGAFQGSRVQLDRAFIPVATPGVVVGSVTLFSGRMATIKLSGSGAELTIRGDNVLFNQMMPRNCFQAGCIHTLGDAGCKVSLSSYTHTGTVGSSPTSSSIPWALGSTLAPFVNGIITFTSGANSGVLRTIQAYTDGPPQVLTLIYPLEVAPAAGDTFSAVYGCDKTQATCTGRFDNLANYRGFPYTPDVTTSY